MSSPPPLFLQWKGAWPCVGTQAPLLFFFKSVCASLLKIPGSTPDIWWETGLPESPRENINAAVNGHLELPLLKDRRRFNAVSTSNLEVYKFRDWWILTYFISGHGESSLSNFWSMVNLERTCVLLFYYFLCLRANLGLEKTNQFGESSPNFIFAVVNLDLIILEKRWIDGESWPNNVVEKVNRGEDLRWVSSRCPLTHA